MVDTALWKLCITVPIVYATLASLEALWSAREILQYLAFVTGFAGFVLLVSRYVVFLIFGLEWIFTPVGGSIGLVIPLVIGFRHAFPYKELVNLNKMLPTILHECLPARGLVQSRHLPFLCLSAELTLSLIFPTRFSEWPLAVVGYFASWFYIRYLMHFPYANVRGDHSSEFVLCLLFPKLLRPTIDKLSVGVYEIALRLTGHLVELRVTEKVSLAVASTLYSPADSAAAAAAIDALATGTPEEKAKFEERRARALRFLDDNIASLMGRKDSLDDHARLVERPNRIDGMSSAEIAEV